MHFDAYFSTIPGNYNNNNKTQQQNNKHLLTIKKHRKKNTISWAPWLIKK